MINELEEIQAERARQINVEGWTAEHDDKHRDGEMLRAAVLYLWHGTDKGAPLQAGGTPVSWPWEDKWWKPKDRRRNLVRAGALCLAEAERQKRCKGYLGAAEHKLMLCIAEIERLDLIHRAELTQ